MTNLKMEGLAHVAKVREYCDYIEEHLRNVAASWKTLQAACADMRFVYDDYVWASIRFHVQAHDLSKFSVEEFIPYQRKFCPVGESDKEGFAAAWQHHQDRNLHHWQNWGSREFYNPYEPEVHCVCMVIDWMAMGLKFGDTAEAYYRKNEGEIEIPDWARSFLDKIFDRLARHATTPTKP